MAASLSIQDSCSSGDRLSRLVLRSPEMLTHESTESDFCSSFRTSPHRVKIKYQDERLCRRQQANVVRLLEAAQTSVRAKTTTSSSSIQAVTLHNQEACTAATQPPSWKSSLHSPTSVLLAKKALRYRNMLDRAQQVNLSDPAFDVARFLGVEWCKLEPKRMDRSREYRSMTKVVNLSSE